MPHARSTAARSAALPRRGAQAHRTRRPEAAARTGGGVQWDRVGRFALLAVAILIVALYVGPIISLFETTRESGQRQQELQQLEQRNQQLKQRKNALGDPATLEREARRLGKVRPGERPYVIEGLPK